MSTRLNRYGNLPTAEIHIGADEFGYILGFPNEEVKQALYDIVLPTLTMRKCNDIQSLQGALFRQLGCKD